MPQSKKPNFSQKQKKPGQLMESGVNKIESSAVEPKRPAYVPPKKQNAGAKKMKSKRVH